MKSFTGKLIFIDNDDYKSFLEIIGKVLKGSDSKIYGWTLAPKHLCLLIQSGKKPLSKLMQRLLARYTLYYQKRHTTDESAYNQRYESIVVQEKYLLDMIRCLHLIPYCEGHIKKILDLERYPWSGHSVIMGNREYPWQDHKTVLLKLGTKAMTARTKMNKLLLASRGMKKMTLWRRQLLIEVRDRVQLIRGKLPQIYDWRILGDKDFVEWVLEKGKTLARDDEKIRASIDKLMECVCKCMDMGSPFAQMLDCKNSSLYTEEKAITVKLAVDVCGMKQVEIARKFKATKGWISKLYTKGEMLINDDPKIETKILKELRTLV